MGIEFIPGEPKISKIYKKAITGDYDAIKAMSDIYDKKDKPFKSLEWFIFGAKKGYVDFMQSVCFQVIALMADENEYENEKLLAVGLYWANKLKESSKNENDTEISNNITKVLRNILAQERYKNISDTMNFEVDTIPML